MYTPVVLILGPDIPLGTGETGCRQLPGRALQLPPRAIRCPNADEKHASQEDAEGRALLIIMYSKSVRPFCVPP